MPLLPHISDTGENLEFMFQTFKDIRIRYIFSASLPLFGGNDPSDSIQSDRKTLSSFDSPISEIFSKKYRMPEYYQNALRNKTKIYSKIYIFYIENI